MIRERIGAAAARSGRSAHEITLVGASKRQPATSLAAAWDAGLRVFGENRVQEAEAKRPHLPDDAEWHLIGPLQSNKARRAVELFDVVESVDRVKIASALDRHAGEFGRRLEIFLEINLGAETSKHGFSPQALGGLDEPLAALVNLKVVGLMSIPPLEKDPGEARRWFERLRRLRDEHAARGLFGEGPGLLSMGMSSDFEVAVEEGATHVRVGTALFGVRPLTTPAC